MEQIARDFTSNDWAFIYLIFIVSLFASSKLIFKKNIEAIFSYDKFIETRDNFWVFSIFINVLISSLLGLIIYKSFGNHKILPEYSHFINSLIISVSIGAVFSLRLLVGLATLYLTNNKSIFNILIRSKAFLRSWVAVLLTPLCFLSFYSEFNRIHLLGISAIIMFSLFITEALYPLKNKLKPQNFSLYYFILYICTLEILPLLLLAKWLIGFEVSL